MNIRELAKERKIKYYCCKSRKALCEELGIKDRLGRTSPRETTLKRVRDGKIFTFKSTNAVARAVDRNSASVAWYVKTKKTNVCYWTWSNRSTRQVYGHKSELNNI